MSRTFSKILVICAMVAIIPLMIVGTAFAAYYSIDSVIVIEALVDQACSVDGTYAKVEYNGKQEAKHTITSGHTTEVDVRAVYSPEAYNFIGWFKGDKADYDFAKGKNDVKIFATTPSITIDMEEETGYIALFEIVKYNVSGWNYKTNPEVETTTDTAPEGKTSFVYGEVLPTPSNYEETGVEYGYEGWQIAGDPSNSRYKVAIFDGKYSTVGTETLALTNPWLAKDRVVVTFHNGNDVRNEEVLKSQPMSQELFNVANQEKGYEYHWEDAEGNTVSSLSPEANTDLYLKKTAVEYTVKVAGVEGEGSYSAENVAFTVENKAALEAAFNAENWTMKYVFWKMEGLSFNNNTYKTADEFATAFLAADMPEDATLTLVTHKYFTTFNITALEYKAGNSGDSAFGYKVYKPDLSADDYEEIKFDSPAMEEQTSANSLNSTIFMGYTVNELKTKIAGTVKNIGLKGFALKFNGGFSDTIEITELELDTLTFNDLLNKYFENNDLVELTETITVAAVEAQFVISE